MTRPDLVVVVVGTATEIGKTWVTAATARHLRDGGTTVAARKPAQSFDPDDSEPLDAEVLAAATGEIPDAVCPASMSYPVPMAPPMAADVLGRPRPSVDDLLAAVVWPASSTDIGFVESVGGLRSPVASDGDSRTLVHRITPEVVVLVADAGLGTINDVRSAVDALAPFPAIVMLNRYVPADDLHRRNRAWLVDVDGFDVVTSVDELAGRLQSRRDAVE